MRIASLILLLAAMTTECVMAEQPSWMTGDVRPGLSLQPASAPPRRVQLASYETQDDSVSDESHGQPAGSSLKPVPDTTQPAFIDLDRDDREGGDLSAGQPSNSALMVRFVTWTVIVLCCCGLTVLGIRRWQRSQGILPTGSVQSRIVETVSLGPGRSVCLVELQDIRALVGCDGTGISSIVIAPPSFEEAMDVAPEASGESRPQDNRHAA